MIAVDSSVVVAAFGSWHERHAAAVAVVRQRPMLPAHAGLEAYSVLTRLPAPHRAPAALVAEFLAVTFSGAMLQLEASAVRDLIAALPGLGVAGGATYDALIGATARAAGATLHTCDRRARETYDRLGITVEFLG